MRLDELTDVAKEQGKLRDAELTRITVNGKDINLNQVWYRTSDLSVDIKIN